jgi:hypothetical protein
MAFWLRAPRRSRRRLELEEEPWWDGPDRKKRGGYWWSILLVIGPDFICQMHKRIERAWAFLISC